MNDNVKSVEDVLAEPENVELATQVEEMSGKAEAVLVIHNDDEYERAATVLKQVKGLIKDAEERRTALVKPLNDHVKNINLASKQITKPLVDQSAAIDKAMVTYYSAKELAATAERNRLALAAAAAQDELNKEAELLGVEAPQLNVPTVLEVERTVGSVSMKARWVGEVENPNLIPRQYLMVDQVKINAAVTAGERNIPGVKIYKKLSTATRS